MLPGNQKGLQSYTAEDIKKRIPPAQGTDWQIRPLNKQLRVWIRAYSLAHRVDQCDGRELASAMVSSMTTAYLNNHCPCFTRLVPLVYRTKSGSRTGWSLKSGLLAYFLAIM